MKPDTEKGIECYVDADFLEGWNQEEDRYPGSLLSRTVCVIMYANCPIIWASRLQTEIVLSKIEAKYIAISQAMRDVLPFMSLMKEISFVLELEDDTPKVKSSLFENPVIVHEDKQGTIALAVAPKMRPCMSHITIKYHHFQSFVANGIGKIQHVDTREQIADILRNP